MTLYTIYAEIYLSCRRCRAHVFLSILLRGVCVEKAAKKPSQFTPAAIINLRQPMPQAPEEAEKPGRFVAESLGPVAFAWYSPEACWRVLPPSTYTSALQ